MKVKTFIFFLFSFFFSVNLVSANTIKEIDMEVYIDENGTAIIEEVWKANLNTGTEGYKSFNKLGKATIYDYKVVDDKNNVYTYTNSWNINGSFSSKSYKNGINYNDGNVELCFGISEYGNREYTLSYKIKDFIFQYNDAQGIYFNFINIDQKVSKATVTISSYYDFDVNNSKIWGFGYKGDINFVDGKIVMTVNNLNSDDYMVGLVKIEDQLFKTGNIVNKDFEEIYNSAKIGVDTYIDLNDTFYKTLFFIPTISLVICLILYLIYGLKRYKFYQTVEFYPPNGVNSLDLAYLCNGSVQNKDVVSLLIYLASKGYLKINDLGKNDFEIIKVKEYDGNNNSEKKFFADLFKRKDKVDYDDLYNSFYRTIDSIKKKYNTKENKYKIFEERAYKKRKYFYILAVLSILLVSLLIAYVTQGSMMFVVVPMLSIFLVLGSIVLIATKNETGAGKVFIYIWASLFMGVPTIMLFQLVKFVTTELFIIFIYAVICLIIMIVLGNLMKKRTEYSSEMYAKIKGFKHFLKTCEKENLESLVSENPKYFYDILPYTYVLGISNKWIKKFESILYEECDWYNSDNFSSNNLSRFMSSTMFSVSRGMQSSPSSSSSGSGGSSFSGGGSSSGGSSGGGFR